MSYQTPTEDSPHRISLWPWVYLIALGYMALHLATSTRYGYFRDALYYLACSEHLAFGYVDQPPLIAVLGWIARHTLGTSLPALLFWPALAGAIRIVLVAAFARELGGRRFAVAFAAALAATPGVWWVIDHQFGMNSLDALLWTGCAYAILRLIKTQDRRWWLVFGLIAGIGVENKYSIAVFAFALLLGLLLTRERRVLFTPWILAGGALAFLIFLPNLIWNIQHHWPFFELMHNVRATGKDVLLPPGKYLVQQIMMMNPLSFPFWFAGLIYYLWSREAQKDRSFGWAFIITLAFFLFTRGKDYYSAPAYPILLAAGAVAAEHLLAAIKRPALSSVLRPACFVWLAIGVAPLLPLILPVLPIETFLRYQSHLPFEVPRTERSFIGAALPQYYADEFNWPEMVATVARVYHSLPPEEQAKTAIFCSNYGQAGAIDFFGRNMDCPEQSAAIKTIFWDHGITPAIVILIGEDEAGARGI